MTSRAAVVTGANRGIGEGIALRLARDGYDVAVVYRKSKGPAEAVVRRLTPNSIALRADVTDEKQAKRAIDAAIKSFGRVDLLVNNVGDFFYSPVSDFKLEQWRELFTSNIDSAFHCAKAVLPHMRKRRAGVIVNIGGVASQTVRGNPRIFPYAMAKTALVVFTKSLAQAEAVNGIRVNIVNPGFIKTYAYTEAEAREMSAMVPMKRLGEPADIAAAVAYLASEDAKYVTGAALDVGGGLWV